MKRFSRWLDSQRHSTRLSFLLQIACRICFSLLSLLWTPMLLHSMGRNLNGLFLNFQKWASLDGCTGDPSAADSNNCQTCSQCSAGVGVTLCVDYNGGHDAAYADSG